MSKTDKTIQILFGLNQRHQFYKRLLGDKFDERLETWIPIFRKHAELAKTDGVLETAISMGKLLSDGNHDPSEMFAMAFELMERKDFSL